MAETTAGSEGGRRGRSRCLLGPLAAGLYLLAQVGCGSAGRPSPAAGWAEGPVRWLILPEEERQFRRLRTGREAALFIELFWRRRDPTPLDPGNPFLEVFHDRVQAADRLYGESEARGSLTDRGRALILLGPPPILRHQRRSVVTLMPDSDLRSLLEAEAETSTVVEEWEYPPDQLPAGLLELLDEATRQRGIVLTFVEGTRRSRLAEGSEVLQLVARALATQPLKLW